MYILLSDAFDDKDVEPFAAAPSVGHLPIC